MSMLSHVARLVNRTEEENDYLHLTGHYPTLEKRRALVEAVYAERGQPGRLATFPRERQNLLLWAISQQEAYHQEVAANGSRAFASTFNRETQMSESGEPVAVTEQPVTTADIAAYPTQQIAFLLDMFEDFALGEVFTTRPMLGPQAWIHSRTFTRNDSCGAYDAGTALNEGRDPSFTECPEECEDSCRIGVQIDGELMEAECRSVAAEYCQPAGYHVSSQYGLSLDAMLDEGMREALQNNIQIEGLDLLRAGAGATLSWSYTAPAGYFSTANPNEWREVLWQRIIQADMAIRTDINSRKGATLVLGDANFIGVFRLLQKMELSFDTVPGGVGPGSANEVTAYQGITRAGRFKVYLFTDMAADTGLVMRRDDNDPTAIFAPWIPITSLGRLVYPRARKVETGLMTLYGMRVLRSGRIREIQLTP